MGTQYTQGVDTLRTRGDSVTVLLTCSYTDKLFDMVTPRILIDVTRLMLGIGDGR